jgi:hypothetical protein
MKMTRMQSSRGLFAFLAAVAMCFSACDCNVKPITKAKGDGVFIVDVRKEPKITLDPADKRHLTVDFGPTLVNQEKPVSKTVILSNDGIAELHVQALNKIDPFNSDVFKVPNSTQIVQSIGTGGTGTVAVSFAPTSAVDYSSDFTLSTDADDTTGKKLTVTLKGTGVDHGCVLVPDTKLDFGNVHTNSSYTRTFSVQNTTPIDWTFTYQGISGADAAYFTTPLAQGAQTIKAHEQLDIQITFTANHPGTANALFQFDSTAACAAPLELTGAGVDSLLSATPAPVDFGFVDPGVAWGTVSQQVVITNIGNDPISLTAPVDANSGLICDGSFTGAGAACAATNEFANSADGSVVDLNNGQLDLDPHATVTLTLFFKPNRLHKATGHMQFSTSAPDQAYFGFDLVGTGGGPKIQVRPDSLDFGVVGIGAAQDRTLVITNIGSGATSDHNADLKITDIVVVPDANTAADEFTLNPSSAYPSLQAGQPESVKVKFDPRGEGDRSATLKIHSNDPVTPEKLVVVKAHGQQLPPCSFTVTPPSLNFGNVVPGRNRILSFRFKNTNADPTQNCLISSLDLSPDTANPPFSLVTSPIASQLVPGGGVVDVQVKFSPNAAATQLTGAVNFFTSSAAQPSVTVPLSGGASAGCLLVAPDDLDFGVVETGCASKEKNFSIYNICNSSVTLTSIELQPDPSGRCPGASCPFTFSHRPNLPLTLSTSGSGTTVDFKMKYLPPAVETDSASVAIQTSQLSSPYLVTLEGRGDTVAVQTDVYRQDAQPKVDVLLVVDDSGSMGDKQAAIAANFQSFIAFAISQQVDYHIGVTTTSTYDSTTSNCAGSGGFGSLAGCGMLMPGVAGGPKVLTNNTPNLLSVFGTNVNVGTSGDSTEQGFEGAYEALSPRPAAPAGTFGAGMQNALEAGLVRDEANLAIIAVSDASDQSNNSYAFYKNFFTNIKGSRRANAFTFSAVTSQGSSPPAGAGNCAYDGTNSVPNPYSTLATETSGVNQEICTTDWASSLRALGQTAFGYRTRFFLSETPDTNFTVDVSIDGVPLPATNSRGAEQWRYNSTANAIDFQPLAVPEPGSTLTITYHVLCYH